MQDSSGALDYYLQDTWGALRMGPDGGVRVSKPLDREHPEGPASIVRVVAVDKGMPKLSATTTLTVTLRDVNDCAPRLLPPHVLHVTENHEPKM